MELLRNLKNAMAEILFPPLCLSCQNYLGSQERDSSICRSCQSKIIVHTSLFCSVCRARLPENKKICHKNSGYLLGAATDYSGPIVNLIHHYKYERWTRLLDPLKKVLHSYLDNLSAGGFDFKKFIIVPIPLHKNREQSRGFNQAEHLAQIIAYRYQVSIIDGLTREKETQIQAKLKNWEDRKKNLEKAFLAANPEMLSGKNILLVDDVYTSGSTINEASEKLKSIGAKKIVALVIAKTK